jgi:hypothetical protein
MNTKKKAQESEQVWQEIAAKKARIGQIAIEKLDLEMEEERIKTRIVVLESGLAMMQAS